MTHSATHQIDTIAPSFGALTAEERDAHELIQAAVNAALSTPVEPPTETYVSNQPYTATALAQISVWLRDNGDEVGAAMLERFAREFARHEATTI